MLEGVDEGNAGIFGGLVTYKTQGREWKLNNGSMELSFISLRNHVGLGRRFHRSFESKERLLSLAGMSFSVSFFIFLAGW